MPQWLFCLYKNDVCIFNFPCCHMLPSPSCLCIILDCFFLSFEQKSLKSSKSLRNSEISVDYLDSLNFTCISHGLINFCHHTRHKLFHLGWSTMSHRYDWLVHVSCVTPGWFILSIMPIKCPYSLWNFRNYLWMTKSKFHVKQVFPSIILNVTNNKNELWKTVRWTSFQKPQLQSF